MTLRAERRRHNMRMRVCRIAQTAFFIVAVLGLALVIFAGSLADPVNDPSPILLMLIYGGSGLAMMFGGYFSNCYFRRLERRERKRYETA